MFEDPIFVLYIQHIYIVIDPSCICRLTALFREKTGLIQDHTIFFIFVVLNA